MTAGAGPLARPLRVSGTLGQGSGWRASGITPGDSAGGTGWTSG